MSEIMKDLRSKIKRQTELLGLVLNEPAKYLIPDLAMEYEIDDLTIKRDMMDFRSSGIGIHSRSKKGISIDGELPDGVIKPILESYIGTTIYSKSFDRATQSLTKKIGSKAIVIMSYLQRGIDSNKKVIISYKKPNQKISGEQIIGGEKSEGKFNGEKLDARESGGLKSDERKIEPLIIYESEGCWRLLAKHENNYKQFLLERIQNIKQTNETFPKCNQSEIRELFSGSFKSYLGKDKIEVKILMDIEWAERLRPKLLLENVSYSPAEDGKVLLETTVNSFNEIAAWIVSRGKGVKVLSPTPLKEMVLKLAKEALENYE
jgi:predicted DNA-binding transcriptional regulator YafY